MSAMDSSGLDGVSTQTRRVASVHAAATASTSDRSTAVWVTPIGP